MKAKITDEHADRVKFVTEDGKTVFEVSVNEDGRSINVRGVDVCRFDGGIYIEALVIEPKVSNSVDISTRLHRAHND